MIETKQAIKEKEDNLYTERNFCGTSNQSEVQNSVSKKKRFRIQFLKFETKL